jgi:anthranilate synthase component I
MVALSFEAFSELAQQGNFVPVYQEWVADLDTPVSAWYRICAGQPYSFLLESVEGGDRLGRYSFLGADPLWTLEARGSQTTQRFRDGRVTEFTGDPFAILAEVVAPYKPVNLPELPPGIGRLFGFWGYELINWIEDRVPVYGCSEADRIPDGCWMQADSVMVFDQVRRKIWAIAYADLTQEPDLRRAYDDACARVGQWVERLKAPIPRAETWLSWTPPSQSRAELKYESNTTEAQFMANVSRAKQHIKAGDIFQVVLSQRLSTEFAGDPFELYRSLRLINPSPYMCFFEFNGWQLIGSSPEVMVKADIGEDGVCVGTVRPIAGTRPRGKTVQQDQDYATDLLADPKEVAEHVMLVDLGRNDLGRVCQNGTVRVDELMVIERYSHVMHIVSNVVGKLDPEKNAWDLLKACFPAGTVSGAPKIRAMEIIHALEGCRRGPYSGVYGFYDLEGQLNSAITIRTMVVEPIGNGKQQVSVQAGAGIVADSVPKLEYEETLNKARGLLEAIRCLQP